MAHWHDEINMIKKLFLPSYIKYFNQWDTRVQVMRKDPKTAGSLTDLVA